jgi:hypothetical protein
LVALLVTLGVFAGTSARSASIIGLVWAFLVLVLFGLAVAYASLFLDAFVVPIMYRLDLPALAAWRRFLPLLRAEAPRFVLYGLFVVVLFIAVGLVGGCVGLVTCCIALLLWSLPYIGTLLLLPLHVTYRILGPEFLAQFDPAFDLFTSAEPQAAAPESTTL